MKGIKKMVCALLLSAMAMCQTSCGGGHSAPVANNDDPLVGEISLSGAFALYPLAVKWAEEFRVLHPNVKIDISAGGAGKGITDALAKVVDLGMVSREIYQPEIEKGAVAFAVAKDAVVPTINARNPVAPELMKRGMTRTVASRLWLTEDFASWNDVMFGMKDVPVHVFSRSDACGAAETWALWMGKKQEDLLGTAVFGDPGVADAVQRDMLGIGFNNIGYVYDDETHKPNEGLLVIPLDVNENGKIDPEESFYDTKDKFIQAVAEGRFPSPPARDLYLVSNGVPENPAVVAFLEYILTEGQQYNVPSGYIGLSEEKLNAGLAILGKQEAQ